MFSQGTVARAELATTLAISIVAEGEWSALTQRNVARAAVAGRYGDRWIHERGYLARTRASGRRNREAPTVAEVAVALLPQAVALSVAETHERERDLVSDLLDPSRQRAVEELDPDVDLVLMVVHGLRATHVPRRPGPDR